jgi:hypothetical protein
VPEDEEVEGQTEADVVPIPQTPWCRLVGRIGVQRPPID